MRGGRPRRSKAGDLVISRQRLPSTPVFRYLQRSGQLGVGVRHVESFGVEALLDGLDELGPHAPVAGLVRVDPDPPRKDDRRVAELRHRCRGLGVIEDPLDPGPLLDNRLPGQLDVVPVSDAEPDGMTVTVSCSALICV